MKFDGVYDALDNKFDFEEFVQKAKQMGFVHNYEEKMFYQQVGLIMGLMAKHNYNTQEAWSAIVRPAQTPSHNEPHDGPSCCGGGQVR